jgi:hypothetical protein
MFFHPRLIVVVAVAALLAVGPAVARAASPYAGEYNGTFSAKMTVKSGDHPQEQVGTLKLTVDADGKIKGVVNNEQLELQATVSGTISEDGEISVTVKYPGQEAATVKGSVTSPKGGRIKGTLTQETDVGTFIVKIDVAK